MARHRLTWTKANRSASAPPADPGYDLPSEHPAAYPDPDAHAYENGDTSSWAEDPHPGPYPNTPHPALPGTEAPMGHPATDPAHYFPGGAQKQAMLRAAMEVKASKCIRIAQCLLGKKASVSVVEDQALDFMNLTDRQIQAALQRMANYTLTEARKADDTMVEEDDDDAEDAKSDEAAEASKKASRHRRLAAYWSAVAKTAGEDDEDEETVVEEDEDEVEASKKASRRGRRASTMPGNQNSPEHYNYRARGVLADDLEAGEDDDEEAEELLAAMVAEEEAKAKEAKKANKAKRASDDEDEDDEAAEEMLASMLKEEEEAAKAKEAKKAEKEEAKPVVKEEEVKVEEKSAKATEAKPEVKPEAKAEEAPAAEKEASELDPSEQELLADMLSVDDDVSLDDDMNLLVEDDPMDLMDTPVDGLDDLELGALYGSKYAGEDKGEEEEVGEVKVEEKPAKAASAKVASRGAQHPQPRKPTNGVRALGGTPTRTASDKVRDLSGLWESAPDLSKIFGNGSR